MPIAITEQIQVGKNNVAWRHTGRVTLDNVAAACKREVDGRVTKDSPLAYNMVKLKVAEQGCEL